MASIGIGTLSDSLIKIVQYGDTEVLSTVPDVYLYTKLNVDRLLRQMKICCTCRPHPPNLNWLKKKSH